jgi:hypothetical protein
MANTNAAGVQYLGSNSPSGQSVGLSATELVSLYGVTPVAQADAIVAVTGTVSLTTTINAVLTAIRNLGVIAS